MRILTVGNMYPPHHYGGYELVWQGAVDHLRASGYDARVLTTDYDTGATEPDPPWVHRDLRYHFRDGEFQRLTPAQRVALARHNHRVLDDQLEDLKPDVVAWWSMGGLTLTLLESVRRRRLPAVAFVHDEWLDYGRGVDPWSSLFRGHRARLAPLAERLAGIPATVELGEAATYVFVSEAMRRFAISLYLGLRSTAVAHSGIHPSFLDPAPEEDWRWRLLYVGRLDARKGVDTAVEALAHLPAAATLRLIGGWDTNEQRRLEDLADRLGVAARVDFAGQLDRCAIKAAYAECDAVVFPTRWREPWGLVPIEAMARGRPVVATGTGGSIEYLRHGENCLLFAVDDAHDLAAKVGRLAADPALRGHLRESGFEVAPRYTETVFNEAVARAVTSAAADHTRPRKRILHIGSGFRPMRHGGLTAYTEDVMNEQSARGDEVTYFFSGRHYPFSRRPRIRRWSSNAVNMVELVNTPLYDHGKQPDLELEEPRIDALLERVLSEIRPDVVNVQELAGLPSSLLDVVRRAGIPCVVTLHDYFPLCSTFQLFDSTGHVCLRRDIGADCVATTAARLPRTGFTVRATVHHELTTRFAGGPRLARLRLPAIFDRLGRLLATTVPKPHPAKPVEFQRRRDVNVERLNRSDRLIANSRRLAEIYGLLGVDSNRITRLQIALAHIERLTPKRIDGKLPIRFATLNGLASEAKGARMVLEAVRRVSAAAPPGSFRLVAYGLVGKQFKDEARRLEAVEVRGVYGPGEIDSALHDIDVGIVPSIWEEAYGFVGPEMLAKGIPLIGNAIGGIVEYVHDGETGWLNRSCSADELAEIMLRVIGTPSLISDLNENIVRRRADIVKPIARHVDELEEVYAGLRTDRVTPGAT